MSNHYKSTWRSKCSWMKGDHFLGGVRRLRRHDKKHGMIIILKTNNSTLGRWSCFMTPNFYATMGN